MKNKIATILMSGLFFMSCNERESSKFQDETLITNALITKEGIYLSRNRNVKLDIMVKNGLVEYSLFDTANNPLLVSDPYKASAFQKWFFLIDDLDNIWFNSSDIGLYLLKRENDTLYKMSHYDINKDSLPKIPGVVYDNLQSSLKR